MRWIAVPTAALAAATALVLAACAGQPAPTPVAPAAPKAAPKAAVTTAASPAPAAPKAAAPSPAAASPVAKTAASPAASPAAAGDAAAQINDFDTRFADLIAKAKQEGTLMLYHTTVVESTVEYVAKFEQRFPGVKVERFRAVAGPLHERFRTEARSNRAVADVIYASNLKLMKDLVDEKLIANYTPASAAAYPNDLKIEGYSYPLYLIRIGGILYNTDLVKEADAAKLRTWEGILDPAFKDNIVLVNPAAAGSQFPVVYLFLQGMPQRFGRPYLEKLAAQNPVVLDSAATAGQRVAAGEFAVLVGGPDEIIYPLHDRKAPVRVAFPPPTPVGPQMVAVTANAPHPNAARLYLEWTMSVEGQRAHSETHGPSYLRSVPSPHPVTKEPWWSEPTELYIPPPEADTQAARLTDEWKQIFRVQ